MLLTNFGVDLNKSVIGFVLRSIESVSACFPCHGKTRVNGGRQKAKTAGVLMNLSRLRQLGPQQFTKKDRRRLARQAFFNYLRSSRYYFSSFDILARSVYRLLTFFFYFFVWPPQQLVSNQAPFYLQTINLVQPKYYGIIRKTMNRINKSLFTPFL